LFSFLSRAGGCQLQPCKLLGRFPWCVSKVRISRIISKVLQLMDFIVYHGYYWRISHIIDPRCSIFI
jgi:hypothetical protein